jgi:hypothetical protein
MGGCGPTPGELLGYEMVVVVVGLMLGLTMWGSGYRLGRRMFGRWFVCSHCLTPQAAKVRDGDLQPCERCGQDSTVNLLDRVTAKEVFVEAGLQVSQGGLWRWTAILTLLTSGAFLGASCMAYWADPQESSFGSLPEWLATPLWVCLGSGGLEYPGLGTGYLFFSFQFVSAIADWSARAGRIPEQLLAIAAYSGILVVIASHWYAGLRRWRRGWLLPLSLAIVNTVAAVIGYMLEVPHYN